MTSDEWYSNTTMCAAHAQGDLGASCLCLCVSLFCERVILAMAEEVGDTRYRKKQEQVGIGSTNLRL